MNGPEPRRRDDNVSAEHEMFDGRSADAPTTEERIVYETADGPEEAPYEPEPRGRNVVTIGRGLFLAMVTFGVLAILALGTATALLALDRRDGDGDDPVIATVNGEQIRRSEYDRAIAQNNGEEVLDGLILERLVAGEARRRNITVDDQETTKLLDEQKQRLGGEQGFQAALTQAGLTETELLRQYRLSAMLRQMVAGQVQVSDQEVDAQYQASANEYQGQPEAQAKEEIRSGLQRQKENSVVGDLLAQLRADAEIETHLPGKPDPT